MFSTAIKGLIAHKLRLFATALAVTLGVAFMAGTLVLTDTVTKTFDDLFGDVYQNTDAVVRGKAVFEGPAGFGAQRGRVDESLVADLRQVSGVAEAQGGVFGYARLVGKDGEAPGNPAMGAPTLGGDWSESARLNPFTLVEGKVPTADDEVVIDAKSAHDGKLAVGDTTTVLVQGPPRTVRISGIVKFGAADSPEGRPSRSSAGTSHSGWWGSPGPTTRSRSLPRPASRRSSWCATSPGCFRPTWKPLPEAL